MFGPTELGPDGRPGRLRKHVEHIERTVIVAAVDLLKRSLVDVEIAAFFDLDNPRRNKTGHPTPAEAARMLAELSESEQPGVNS